VQRPLGPWRDVVDRKYGDFVKNPRDKSLPDIPRMVWLTLACGHEVIRPVSYANRTLLRCEPWCTGKNQSSNLSWLGAYETLVVARIRALNQNPESVTI
jgi:hypothetical protein